MKKTGVEKITKTKIQNMATKLAVFFFFGEEILIEMKSAFDLRSAIFFFNPEERFDVFALG